jgi:hypothetical protein
MWARRNIVMANEATNPAETPTEAPVEAVTEAPQQGPTTLEAVEVEAAPEAAAGVTAESSNVGQQELEELRANEVAFSWQAAEYVQHHKGLSWYLGLAGALVVLLGLALLVKDWMAIAAFVVAAIAAVVYAHKPPRTMLYELTPTGISIDGKQYPYTNLRSFGVLADEAWHTIDLEPTQRLAPRISILFQDNDFESIVGHLELHLPRIDRKPDVVERLTRYLRF